MLQLEVKGTHPEEIKAAMRMNGVTAAMLADELKVSQSSISHVINKRSRSERIENRIAELVGLPRDKIFPRKTSLLRRHPNLSQPN
ncbi:helix-turn-helix domain-containing protein [Marinomonas sp. S3726]|uniref:helix-turn-helix domain-containing protein n=1 Tax=Marinomonas sp. S3726 TaxID=579484 RepID=UPI0005FA792C|nr:helix-turn-helix domain-containing protein [Marinomonas sp. S3726]